MNPFTLILATVGLSKTTHPNATVFCDTLPGMSVEMAAKLRPESAGALWERLQGPAMISLLSGIETTLKCKANFVHVLSRVQTGLARRQHDVDSIAVLPPAAGAVRLVTQFEELGAILKIDRVTFFLRLLAPGIETADIVVLDDDSGREVLRKSVPVQLGLNNVTLNLSVPIEEAYTELHVYVESKGNMLSLMPVEPYYTTDPDRLKITSLDSTHGPLLHVAARLECNVAALAGQYAEKLAMAYCYTCAVALLNEKRSSNLLNVFTQTNSEDTEDRIVEYQGEAGKLIGIATHAIYKDLSTAGSAFIETDEEDQPGIYMGSYVQDSD